MNNYIDTIKNVQSGKEIKLNKFYNWIFIIGEAFKSCTLKSVSSTHKDKINLCYFNFLIDRKQDYSSYCKKQHPIQYLTSLYKEDCLKFNYYNNIDLNLSYININYLILLSNNEKYKDLTKQILDIFNTVPSILDSKINKNCLLLKRDLQEEKISWTEYNKEVDYQSTMIEVVNSILITWLIKEQLKGNFRKNYIIDTTKINLILLLDDLLHKFTPKNEYLFLNFLYNTFPNIQFVITTNSPVSLLSKGKSITVKTSFKNSKASLKMFENEYYKNLTPNSLLTSEIFDCNLFNDSISLQDLRNEDDYKEIVFEKILDKKLAEMAQIKEDRFNQLFNPEKK
jgi:hypothetical protein